MKRTLMFSLLFSFIVLLSSCGCKKDKDIEKINGIGRDGLTTFISLETSSELQAMLDNEEDFILYIHSAVCNNCKEFRKDVLDPFIAESDLVIYGIESSIAGLGKIIKVNSTPSLVIYNDGLIIDREDPRDGDAFDSVAGLRKYLSKYVYLPQVFYIDKAKLDSLLGSSEKFFLFFESETCGDCYMFKHQSLYPYVKENALNVKFYIFEVSEFRESTEAGVWQQFKDTYGLSNAINQKGYGLGYVPTIQYIEAGRIVDMMVFFNDTDKVTHEDGTFSYQTSYYPNESPALTGKFKSYTDYQNKTFSFYNRKFVELVNNYNVEG